MNNNTEITPNKQAGPKNLSGERLGGFQPRHRNTTDKSETYSTFIKRMRILLPMGALCIIAVLFSWDILKSEKIVQKVNEEKTKQDISKNELLAPNFAGTDEKGQPYTITAQKAVQSESDDQIILLTAPLGDILLENGKWLAISSKEGAYHQSKQKLNLKDQVNLFHDEGYNFSTDEIDIDLAGKTAATRTHVQGQGPKGILDAASMQADLNTGTLIFNGPAKLIIYKGADSALPTAENTKK